MTQNSKMAAKRTWKIYIIAHNFLKNGIEEIHFGVYT